MMDIEKGIQIDSMRIAESIELLNKFVDDSSIDPFIAALEALKNDTGNKSLIAQVITVWNELGITQGAVLTYAPYVWLMLSEDPFGEK